MKGRLGAHVPEGRQVSGADRLLSVDDLAAYLDVPVKTIYAWRHRSTGPRGFRVGRHLRFRWADVEEWLAELASEDGH